MASDSCEAVAERIENSIGVDRFSNLPDEIAHEIMSGFYFKDLTCLGCVSKKCKKLQLSISFINLAVSRRDNVGNMLDAFDDFLIQRGDNKIQIFVFYSFGLGGDTSDDEKLLARLSRWINNAVRCNVEKLAVELFPKPDILFSLPNAQFLFGSLKFLFLGIKCVIGGDEVSSFPSLSNLEWLKLASVSIIDESFWRWISCSCKRLQRLNLGNIHGSRNIIIESPSLKTFRFCLRESDCFNLSICANRLERIYIDWDYSSSNQSLNISTPNAKRFEWYGTFPSHLNLGEMRFLNECKIFCNGNVPESAMLVDILCCVRWVKTLELDDGVLKALSKDGFTFAPLDKVCCLNVTCDLTDELVPGLVRLLQRKPSLRSLRLNTHTNIRSALLNYGGFDMEFWKQQKLAFVDCLKFIAIALYSGSNGFEFARYILKHARNLERMDIFCDPNQYDEVMKLQDEMTSSGTLIFHQVLANDRHFEMSEF